MLIWEVGNGVRLGSLHFSVTRHPRVPRILERKGLGDHPVQLLTDDTGKQRL